MSSAALADPPVARNVAAQSCLDWFRHLTAGVAVLSVAGPQGPRGITASTVTSVSVDPPLLLACVASGSGTLAAIRAGGAFGVQLLRDDQESLARACARPGPGLGGLPHRMVDGVPLVTDALATALCQVVDCRGYGDHHVLVGRVWSAEVGGGPPLVWHASRFTRLRPARMLTGGR